MAEAILALIGFPVAAFATLEAFHKCGEYIAKKVESYKHAPKIVNDFKVFGADLHAGSLKLNLDIAEWAFSIDNLPAHLRTAIEGDLEKLYAQLIAADKLLDKYLRNDGKVRKGYFLWHAEDKLKACVKELQSWQDVFLGTIKILEMHRRTSKQTNLLTPRKLTIIPNSEHNDGVPLEPGSNLRLASAEVKDPQVRRTMIILEKRAYAAMEDDAELMDATSNLARTLSDQKRGILRCLGYRTKPRLELVFEIPETLENPQTLRRLMLSDQVHGYGGGHKLEHRFKLALQLSQAVLSVHTKSLVHKNIRSNTVVILKLKDEDGLLHKVAGIGSPFLGDWSSVRGSGDITSPDPNLEWKEDLYKHPKRQGLQPADRYHMGHDIYSLGVCLLEIGLWQSFIVEKNGTQVLADTFAQKAIKLGYMKEADVGSTKRVIEADDVKKIMEALTQELLLARMGSTYSQVVLSCLNCADGGFGDIKDFEDASIIGVKFNELVVTALSSIRL